jgi:hypothetical protein
VKSNINSVEVHPQLNNNGHPVDGAVVGAGSLPAYCRTFTIPATSFQITFKSTSLPIFHSFTGSNDMNFLIFATFKELTVHLQ